jgi:ribonuclease Z
MVFYSKKIGERKLDLDAVQNYGIETYYQKKLNGNDITLEDGTLIDNYKITFDPAPAKATHSVFYDESILHCKMSFYITNLLLKSGRALAKKRCILLMSCNYCSQGWR